MPIPELNLPIIEAQTRFILSFSFAAQERDNLSKSIESLRWRDQQVWRAEELPSVYHSEYLACFAEFYFGEGTASYYTVPADLQARWFGRALQLNLGKGKTCFAGYGGNANLHFGADSGKKHAKPAPPIELWLTPHGFGLLSITLIPLTPPETWDVNNLKRFNYALAQRLAAKAAPLLALNDRKSIAAVPLGLPQKLHAERKVRAEKFADLLGNIHAPNAEEPRHGDWFTLSELAQWLLSQIGCEPTGGDTFQIYTTAVLRGQFGLTSIAKPPDIPDTQDLVANVAAMSQIEEDDHPLPTTGLPIVACEILDTRSVVAVSTQGAAQLYCEQTPEPGEAEHEFNNQLLRRAITRRWPAFAAATLQRLVLLRLSKEIPPMAGKKPDEEAKALAELRNRLLLFLLQGFLTEISPRAVTNRFYAVCQNGLHVQQHRQMIQDSLTALEQNSTLRQMHETSETAEWIEFLVLTIYAVEATHIFAGLFGWREGPAGWAAAVAMLVTVVGYWVLKGLPGKQPLFPWGHYAKLFSVIGLIAASLASLAWLGEVRFNKAGSEETRHLAEEIDSKLTLLKQFPSGWVEVPRVEALVLEAWREREAAMREIAERPAQAKERLIRALGDVERADEVETAAKMARLAEEEFLAACGAECRAGIRDWEDRRESLNRYWRDGDYEHVHGVYKELKKELASERASKTEQHK